MKTVAQVWGGVVFTVLLVGIIAAGVSDIASLFFLVLVGSVGIAAVIVHTLFPGSRLFSLALANLIAVYACLFVFFTSANFAAISDWAAPVGFVLPVFSFLLGSWHQRNQISAIVHAQHLHGERSLTRAFRWLAPVFAIGALTFLLPAMNLTQAGYDLAFIAAMSGIALIVLAVSRDVASFLVQAGFLFEEFFRRIRHLVVPTFAFLTFYSLQVIVFASLYRIIDHYSSIHHFIVYGEVRDITFLESLYFSVITVSTVGYGDILPQSDAVRALASVQIVMGVLLLLFGFSEIMSYSRERRGSGTR